jgi:hypothetical protein
LRLQVAAFRIGCSGRSSTPKAFNIKAQGKRSAALGKPMQKDLVLRSGFIKRRAYIDETPSEYIDSRYLGTQCGAAPALGFGI